jgi:hypothetical protein
MDLKEAYLKTTGRGLAAALLSLDPTKLVFSGTWFRGGLAIAEFRAGLARSFALSVHSSAPLADRRRSLSVAFAQQIQPQKCSPSQKSPSAIIVP